MRYLDVCAGISASTVAWKPLGWTAVAYSEIEAAPRAVLAHHYPDVALHGDFTTIKGDEYGPVDLLVGGTPCQDFSVAGLRKGLAGDRGNLTLEFLRLADRVRPRWVVWENVPGVLSIDGGRAFGAFLGGLGQLGYGFAYRVLDAQHFGVPQRRRRVLVIGCAGDWRRAAAVLLERHSLSGHPAPRREAGQVAPTIPSRSLGGGGLGTDFDCDGGLISSTGQTAHCLNAGGMGRQDYETETLIAFSAKDHGADAMRDLAPTLRAGGHSGSHPNAGVMPAVAYGISSDAIDRSGEGDGSAGQRAGMGVVEDGAPCLRARSNNAVATASAVRRLTPRECERLQGFPDDYTLVPHRGKPMADGPRYKALGNSMAVPVMRWIGERIAAVEALAPMAVAA